MICYVILHFQAIDETEKCVRTIKKCSGEDYHIVIVDNASPNGTGNLLKENFKNDDRITVMLNKENTGFARGNNLGYKAAKKYMPDYICILNSDVEITQRDFDSKLDIAYKKYHFDVLGPDIFSTRTQSHQNPQRDKNYTMEELQKAEKILNFKNKFKFLLKIKYYILHKKVKQNIHENDYKTLQEGKVLHGAFYVFSKNFIEQHNNCFYQGTFMYYESYILHYLGMKENMKFLYYPDIVVKHHEDASTDATYTDQYKKSIFVNKCLLDSCKVFIKLMNTPSAKLS